MPQRDVTVVITVSMLVVDQPEGSVRIASGARSAAATSEAPASNTRASVVGAWESDASSSSRKDAVVVRPAIHPGLERQRQHEDMAGGIGAGADRLEKPDAR